MTLEEKSGWRGAESTFNRLYYTFSVSSYEGGTQGGTLVENQRFIIMFLSKCSQQISFLKSAHSDKNGGKICTFHLAKLM